MTRPVMAFVFFGITLSTVSGCASASTRKDFADLEKKVESKTQLKVEWNKNEKNNEEINQRTRLLFKDKLTVDASVEIALMNNPSLQATLEDLGIAKADLVQSGLLRNPVVSGSIRKPNDDGKANTEFEVKQDILDLFTLPLRKKFAREQLEQVKYTIGDAILHFDNEVRSAYYILQSAQQMYVMQEKIVKAADSSLTLAERQFKAGNINDLVLTGHQVALYQTKMDLAEQEVEVKAAREDLSRLMGISADDMSWEIVEELPFIANEEPTLEVLENKAMSQNFELAIARQDIKVREKALTVNRMNMIPEVSGGYNTERESDGEKLSGPVFEFEVPIFDQKQSGVSRGQAQLRQSQRRLESKEREIRSEIRKTYAKLLNTRQMVETYRDTLIPLRAKFTDSLLKHYNFMLVGVYDLLEAKKEEFETYHIFIEALKDYWIIRSDLERLIAERIEFVPYVSKPAKAEMEDESKPSTSQPVQNHSSHGGKK